MLSGYMTKKVNSLKWHLVTKIKQLNNFIGLGFITTDLLREILRELDDKITPTDLDQMIEEIDADGSGTVDWEGM